jgi:hypothetical protein
MQCVRSRAQLFTDEMLLCPRPCLAGKAGVLATEIDITCRSLRYLFSNLYAPGLRLLSGSSDIPYQLEVSQYGWARVAAGLNNTVVKNQMLRLAAALNNTACIDPYNFYVSTHNPSMCS